MSLGRKGKDNRRRINGKGEGKFGWVRVMVGLGKGKGKFG